MNECSISGQSTVCTFTTCNRTKVTDYDWQYKSCTSSSKYHRRHRLFRPRRPYLSRGVRNCNDCRQFLKEYKKKRVQLRLLLFTHHLTRKEEKRDRCLTPSLIQRFTHKGCASLMEESVLGRQQRSTGPLMLTKLLLEMEEEGKMVP